MSLSIFIIIYYIFKDLIKWYVRIQLSVNKELPHFSWQLLYSVNMDFVVN